MNALVLRGFFVVVIFASLVIRQQAIQTRDGLVARHNISAAISNLAMSNGMTLLENSVKPPKILSTVVYFKRPECALTSLVMPFSFSSDAQRMLDRLNKPGYTAHYYYFDQSWDEQHRILMFWAWIKQSGLSIVGLSDYVPVHTAIVLAEPSKCIGGREFDWPRVWNKSVVRPVQLSFSPLTKE